MLNQENFNGFWYPADQPEIRFHAVLNFGPDKSPRLTGISTFTAEQATFLRNAKEITIWGDLEGGENVTLFECNCLSLLYPWAGTQSVELNAKTVVSGAFLKNSAEVAIEGMQVDFTVLGEWMDTYGHTTGYDENSDTHSLLYKAPEDIQFAINEQINAAFIFRMFREIKEAKVAFRQENLLSLKFLSPVSYDDALECEWRVQRFLTVAVWQQLNIISLSIRIKTSEATEYSDGYKWCRVFFRQSTYGLAEEGNKTYFLRFLVVRPVIEPMLQSWFKLEELTEPVISLLIANIGRGDGFIQNNFLNLVQAVEAFHRHIKQNTDQLKAEHTVKMDRILEQVRDASDKRWLSEKLAFAFEPSLRRRLKELFQEHCSVIFYNNDVSNKSIVWVIETITDKRNYYTHYGKKISVTDADFMRLIVLTELLKLLLAVMIFRELGMDKEVLRERIPGRLKVKLPAK